MSKPGLPQGTRDFSATVVQRRQYIFQTIRRVFETYGFQPLETPAMENLETLMGKYGEEGDQLIFKILNNGLANPDKADRSRAALENVLAGKSSKDLTERALRYDLTIPFARYVAMNHGQLTFPFKRYQVQPVWRADRPQKGRYREFYQCDADIVGSSSLQNETELVLLYAAVFQALQLPITLKLNNRKVLAALAQTCGGPEWMVPITVAIDKLDKIGWEKVAAELENKGLPAAAIEKIKTYLSISGNNAQKATAMRALLGSEAQAETGLAELETILAQAQPFWGNTTVELDFTLARGLNYYTGTIFEVKAQGVQMGSIGGGGRYDDLTGLFGVPNLPGVGISFGVDRIYDVMEELALFPTTLAETTQLLFFHLGQKEAAEAFRWMQTLRAAGIATELFHEQQKFDKQFRYAEKKQIPFVAILGSDELAAGKIVLKNLSQGSQSNMGLEALLLFFQQRAENPSR
jgi:histidyl-tRNA synthetase